MSASTSLSVTLLLQLLEKHGKWRKVGEIVGMAHESCRNHCAGRYNATPRMLARLSVIFPEHAQELLSEYKCKQCGKQLSLDRIESARGTNFCGLECRRKWRKKMYKEQWNRAKSKAASVMLDEQPGGRMRVVVEKITSLDLARRACAFTTGAMFSNINLDRLYNCEHSPMRTQLFWVEMHGIPTFVSVHFVRHKIGVEHYVKSNRVDRGGDGDACRTTPVDHAMLCNAQALINMARKRLCHKASKETVHVMAMIRYEMRTVDHDLSAFMMPECLYRGNVCHELKPCGKQPGVEVAK